MIHFLHISDLHLIVNPEWNNMKTAILDSVKQKLANIENDNKLLIITGDFHNFKEKNFEEAKTFLQELFAIMELEPDKDVFVIPGNHDISDDSNSVDRDVLVPYIKNHPEELYNKNRLEQLLTFYDPYLDFLKSLGIYNDKEIENKLPIRVHVRNWRGKINFLHLNTTIVADGKEKKNQIIDALSATSDKIREELRNGNSPRFVIGHNSFFDLHKTHQEQLRGVLFQENISAYICGDLHKIPESVDKNYIILSEGKTIPNIVSYKSSVDEKDEYSDSGIIWHNINDNDGNVNLEYFKWERNNQAKLVPDTVLNYNIYDAKKIKTEIHQTDKTDCWLDKNDILKSASKKISPNNIKSFLLGSRCTWNIVFQENLIPRRKIVDDLYNCITTDGGTYALTAPGGEGKSTALMQLCSTLINNNYDVLYYKGIGKIQLPDCISEKTVFLIDNPPENKAFKKFLNSVIANGYTLVLAERENEWNLLKTALSISDRDIKAFSMDMLTEKEAQNFAECVCNNLYHSKSFEEIKEIFLKKSDGFLYAAMLLAVSNKNTLDAIANTIIEKLHKKSKNALLLLAHIVISEECNVDFGKAQYRDVCQKLNIPSRDANNALSKEVSLNGTKYQTRHERIRKLFTERLFSYNSILQFNEIDKTISNLFEFHFKLYSNSTYFSQKQNCIFNVAKLLSKLELVGSETQAHLINRLIDEFKISDQKTFSIMLSYLNDEELKLLFYKVCFNREWYSSYYLKNWCEILIKNGAKWPASRALSIA